MGEQQLYMRLVLNNVENQPIYLEIPIPEGVMGAVRSVHITNCEFLFFEKGASNRFVTPAPMRRAETELLDFHHFKK